MFPIRTAPVVTALMKAHFLDWGLGIKRSAETFLQRGFGDNDSDSKAGQCPCLAGQRGAKEGGAGAKPRDAISDPNLGQLSYETYGDTNPTVGTKTKPIQVPRIYVQKDGVAQSTYAYWVRDSERDTYLRKHDTHDAEIIEDLASMHATYFQ